MSADSVLNFHCSCPVDRPNISSVKTACTAGQKIVRTVLCRTLQPPQVLQQAALLTGVLGHVHFGCVVLSICSWLLWTWLSGLVQLIAVSGNHQQHVQQDVKLNSATYLLPSTAAVSPGSQQRWWYRRRAGEKERWQSWRNMFHMTCDVITRHKWAKPEHCIQAPYSIRWPATVHWPIADKLAASATNWKHMSAARPKDRTSIYTRATRRDATHVVPTAETSPTESQPPPPPHAALVLGKSQ